MIIVFTCFKKESINVIEKQIWPERSLGISLLRKSVSVSPL